MKRLTPFALGLLLLTGCSVEPALPSFGVVPDFVLTDQSGRQFDSKEQLAGRVWVADFVYTTCPGPCPRMSSQMRRIQDGVKPGSAFTLVSFTVDPERDTPRQLNDYLTSAAYSKGVVGLTYEITNEIVTAGGRTLDQSFIVLIKQR